ncbi:MAG: FkbM family methyltransferase [Deltaproteobacteria bacterium]|nr:FkbM family methyltransferase [Deltaproteobacteria bacterium]
MDHRTIIEKASRLLEILALPQGLPLKLRDPSFDTGPLRVCTRLRDAGIAPASVFDVGANRGQFALAARTVFPNAQIHSYEPIPATFAELSELAQRRGGIAAHNLALGTQAGTQKFTVTSNSVSSSFLPLHENHLRAYPEIQKSAEIDVQVSTLALQLAELEPPQPVLLKLDVQGFEAEVLEGAGESLKQVKWIVLETSTRPLYQGQVLFDELCARLGKRGFRFAYPMDLHFGHGGGVSQFDALFERSAD